MDKNSVIGFILIAVIFIGFSVFQSGQMRKQAELQAQLDSVARAEALQQQVAEAERLAALPDSLRDRPAAPVTIYKDSALEAASHAQASLPPGNLYVSVILILLSSTEVLVRTVPQQAPP